MAREVTPTRSGSTTRSARSGKGWRQALVFLAPAFVLYSLFLMYPLVTAVSYSFFEWRGTVRGAFAGLDNYAALFGSSTFGGAFANAFWNNVLIFAGNLAVQLTVGLGCAVLLMHRTRFRRFFQTAITVPYLVNPLAIGFLFTLVFSPQLGPINNILRDVGLGDWAQPWLGQESTILPIVIAVGAWQWVGFPVLIFSAALASIPPEYEEAARLDGASPWRIFRSVTLPLLTPAIGSVTVLGFVSSFTTFALVIGLTDLRGGLSGAADTLMLIFYRTAFGPGVNAVGTSSAIAVLIFVVVFGVAVVFNRIMRRREEALT
ncbi:carbohydrate ABC transporter permease [Georgenia faecalis]|uniref:Carbohydrate ABC transporter permease n=1 Tax=Georgenia faecalis TaxID=2483799 RepID=A0ABV9D9T9_9MICO|nr:sugar ABC transporter permease [Georgenia faecalis]